MGLSGIPLGAKNKYKKMNSKVPDDNDDVLHPQQREDKRNSTRKYVIACAIFASLNNVLLGFVLMIGSLLAGIGIVYYSLEILQATIVQVAFYFHIQS